VGYGTRGRALTLAYVAAPCHPAGMTHIDVPPGRAAQSLWCGRNWHDGTCCPGSIRQWHEDHDLLPPEHNAAADHCPRCGRKITDYDRLGREGDDGQRECNGPCPGVDWTQEIPHERGDHSACNRNCEETL
jgi:hypothetical protein